MKEETSDLEDLKKQYLVFKQKYNLPEFTELNELFDIEEINIETEFLLRRIRRMVSEKLTGYLRFIDILLNPNNAPIFFFKLIKKLDKDDRELLSDIYQKLGNFEIEIISLDLEYSGEKEAEFINKVYKTLKTEIRKNLAKIIEKLNAKDNNYQKINGSYFG